MQLFAWLLLFSCNNAQEQQQPEPVTSSETLHHWAWPAPNGTFVQQQAGVLVTHHGTVTYKDAKPCVEGWFEAPIKDGLITFPVAPMVTFEPSPAVQAATVERVSWRLRQALPASNQIQLGGISDIAPAVSDGLLVRSVRKYRRSGPPVLAVLGVLDNTLIVALTDRDAAKTLATAVETVPTPSMPTPLPISDLNGDGTPEWLIYSDGSNPYRLMVEATLDPRPALGEHTLATQPKHLCESH